MYVCVLNLIEMKKIRKILKKKIKSKVEDDNICHAQTLYGVYKCFGDVFNFEEMCAIYRHSSHPTLFYATSSNVRVVCAINVCATSTIVKVG